jgi:hypothetical protein
VPVGLLIAMLVALVVSALLVAPTTVIGGGEVPWNCSRVGVVSP